MENLFDSDNLLHEPVLVKAEDSKAGADTKPRFLIAGGGPVRALGQKRTAKLAPPPAVSPQGPTATPAGDTGEGSGEQPFA